MRVLFYSLGGGAGHVCRSLAVARELSQQTSVDLRFLIPQRLDSWLDPNIARSSPREIDRESLRRWLLIELQQFQPDLLCVDVFPRGILGEFPELPGLRRILLTRWVDPEYYNLPEVSESLGQYSQVFSSEPFTWGAENGRASTLQSVNPIVWTRSTGSKAEAKLALGGSSKNLVLALGSGPTRPQQRLQRLLQEIADDQGWQLRFCSESLGSSSPGLGRHFHGADLIISAAGYQSYHEILQSGAPAILLPQRRRYDNQAARALGSFGPAQRASIALARGPQELRSLIPTMLKEAHAEPICFDGAREVARRALGARVDSLQ